MRKKQILLIAVFFILIASLPNGYTQDYRKWQLPENAKLRLGKGILYDVKFLPDGTQFAVKTDIGVWIYDADTNEEIALFKGPTGSVASLAYSADRKMIALTRHDDMNVVELWDLHTREQKTTFKANRERIEVLAFAPQGQILAGASGSKVLLWDLHTGKLKTKLTADLYSINILKFSPDGKTLAITEDNPKNAIQLWDVKNGIYLTTLEGHTDRIDAIEFSPDSVTLASGDRDGTILLWDTKTQTRLMILEDYSNINAMAFSPDGKTLAVPGDYQSTRVQLWDIDTGQLRKTIEGKITNAAPFQESAISVTFSPNGTTLASANANEIWLWDTATNTCSTTLTRDYSWLPSVPFSPQGRVLACGSRNGTIHLWDIATAQIFHSLTGAASGVSPLAFSVDGKMFACKSGKDTIELWDTLTNKQDITLQGDISPYPIVAFSPDGTKLACTGEFEILLWDTHTGKLRHKLAGHFGRIRPIVFSPDSTMLASAGEDQFSDPKRDRRVTMRLWNTETGELLTTFTWDTLPDRFDRDYIEIVAFSPDGKILVCAGPRGVQLWDVQTRGVSRQPRAIFTNTFAKTIAFSPDGATLATAGYSGIIQLLDTETGKLRLTLGAHPRWITSLVFSPEGDTLASSGSGIVLLWDLKKTAHPIR